MLNKGRSYCPVNDFLRCADMEECVAESKEPTKADCSTAESSLASMQYLPYCIGRRYFGNSRSSIEEKGQKATKNKKGMADKIEGR